MSALTYENIADLERVPLAKFPALSGAEGCSLDTLEGVGGSTDAPHDHCLLQVGKEVPELVLSIVWKVRI